MMVSHADTEVSGGCPLPVTEGGQLSLIIHPPDVSLSVRRRAEHNNRALLSLRSSCLPPSAQSLGRFVQMVSQHFLNV